MGDEILPGIFTPHCQSPVFLSITPSYDLAHHFLTTSNIIYVFYYVGHCAEHRVDDSWITPFTTILWRPLGPRP